MVWKTAKADEKLNLVRDINRIESTYRFNPDESFVEILDLPFYPGGKLVSLTKSNVKGAPLWYVNLPRETVVLDGSIANIHHANAAAPLKLSAETIADYLKFRLYFGKQGWLEGVLATESGDGYNATARVLEQDGMYEATLNVSPRGEVTVLNREKIGDADRRPPETFSL